jgi:DNA-binding MarR family transcriptional regulator
MKSDDTDTLNNIVTNISYQFFELQTKLQFFEREYLLAHNIIDVTPNEAKVLYIIGTSNTKSMTEIADKLRVTQGTLSVTINSLERKGYVLRNRHKQDRRIIILYLTEKSLDLIRQYEHFYYELTSSLIQEIDESKVMYVKEILSKLNQIVESEFYKGNENYE